MRELENIKHGNRREHRFGSMAEKLWNSPLFLAVFFNILAFLIRIIFFDIKYEVSDDYMTDAILSGAFGEGYDPNLLFGNPILGRGLVLFYRLIPKISFYFVLLIVLSFLSVTAILYILFKKNRGLTAKVMAVVFLVFYADDLYILVQFTKVSAAAGIAGGLMVLYGLWEEKVHRVRWIVSGTVLTVLGAMVRFDTIYIFAFFLVVQFAAYAFPMFAGRKSASEANDSKGKSLKSLIPGLGKRFLVCVILIGFLFGLQIFGEWTSNQDQKHKDFNTFHPIRCGITDVMMPSYDDVKDEYARLGLDELDYFMLCTWNFVDREVYSDELLQQVGEIHKKISAEKAHSPRYILSAISARRITLYWSAIGLYILIVIAALLGKRRLFPLAAWAAALFMFAVFIYTGRTMYRVEWSVYFCAAACILTHFGFDEEASLSKYKKMLFGKEMRTVEIYMAILILGLLGTRITRILPDTEYRNMSDSEYIDCFNGTLLDSGSYVKEKYEFPSLERKPFANIVNRMESDSDHFYYVDFFTGIQSLYFAYDPWIRPQQGLFSDSYAYFGSVALHHPGEQAALAKNGADPDSPYKSLTNDNIYLVDSEYPNVKLAFIRRYYYPDAQMELVDELDEMKIWKIYIPEGSDNNDQL